jgi:REP element-mobilizing transposase RayT
MKTIETHKSHNVNKLYYHFVFATKYRRNTIDDQDKKVLVEACLQKIEARHEISFVEIGADGDHIHFLIQSVPTLCCTQIVTLIKGITGRALMSVKEKRAGQKEYWNDGYYVATVGERTVIECVKWYVRNQGKK